MQEGVCQIHSSMGPWTSESSATVASRISGLHVILWDRIVLRSGLGTLHRSCRTPRSRAGPWHVHSFGVSLLVVVEPPHGCCVCATPQLIRLEGQQPLVAQVCAERLQQRNGCERKGALSASSPTHVELHALRSGLAFFFNMIADLGSRCSKSATASSGVAMKARRVSLARLKSVRRCVAAYGAL